MKKKMITGFACTGELTIGNYIGSIKQALNYQNEYDLYVFAANLHALTQISGKNSVRFSKDQILKNTYKIIATLLACGIKKEKVFVQSMFPQHSELQYILACCTTTGQLNRMTQFKSKIQKNILSKTVPTGLLIYPTLMAADILLFNVNYVPVGIDQKQHVELCRDLAIWFNKKYEEIFVIPTPVINKVVSKIYDLQNPTKKMSKSNVNKNSYILLSDDKNNIYQKIKAAKTDSENKIYFNKEKKPGLSNLLVIYSAFSNNTLGSTEKKFKKYSYIDFKNELAELLWEKISIIQNKYKYFYNEKKIKEILFNNFQSINKIETNTINKVKKAMGLI